MKPVILNEAMHSMAQSKDLRIPDTALQKTGAKILRLVSLAQDDKLFYFV